MYYSTRLWEKEPLYRKQVTLLKFFVYLIIFFAFFDLFAQLPIISPFAVALGSTPFLAGLAVGMYSLSNTVGNLISGIYADRRGPFAVLILGLVATSITLYTYGLAEGPYSLLAIRFFHGLAAGLTVPAAFTYLANNTDKSRRGKGAAVSGAFVGIAAITGPAFGAIYTSRTSVPETMFVTGTLILLVGLLSFLFLRKHSAKKERRAKVAVPLKVMFGNVGLIQAFSGAFFLMFSQGVLAYMLPLKVVSDGHPSETSGLLLSTFGIAAILVFLLPINRLFDRIPPRITMIIGFVLMGSSQLLLSTVSDISITYAIMCLYGVGFAFLFPSINSLLIDSTVPDTRGRAYGLFYAFFSIGVVAGSSITGALALDASGGFILSGCILVGVALLNFLLTLKKSQENA